MSSFSKIFLIGFMGSGKSSIGKKLSRKLKVDFIDLDSFIEEREDRTILEIFDINGEEYFRKVEQKSLIEIIKTPLKQVIALGGGTPCYHNNMELINNSGTSIYLKYNSGVLVSRLLKSKIQRPLLKGKTEDQISKYVKELLQEREQIYNRSKYIIENETLKVNDLVQLLQDIQ